MLSRVADSIYWMHRYMERAENVARFVDVNLYLTLDLPPPVGASWEPVVATTGDTAAFRARYGDATPERVMRFLTFDADYPNSIVACLWCARENARSVREAISSEAWEQVNKTYLMVKDAAAAPDVLDAPHEFFTAVKLACQLFVGITHATMTHNEGWHFGQLGQLIERADKTSRIVDVKYLHLAAEPAAAGSPYDEIQWAALLKSASALEMYRKRHGRIAPPTVLEFLLLERQFPRSLRYCVAGAQRSLREIAGAHDHAAPPGHAATRLAALRAELDEATAACIAANGVHRYLDGFQTRLNAVGDAVSETFFARAD